MVIILVIQLIWIWIGIKQLLLHPSIKSYYLLVMMSTGLQEKEPNSKMHAMPGFTWHFSAVTKYIGRPAGKTITGHWFVIKKEQWENIIVVENAILSQVYGPDYGGMDVRLHMNLMMDAALKRHCQDR